MPEEERRTRTFPQAGSTYIKEIYPGTKEGFMEKKTKLFMQKETSNFLSPIETLLAFATYVLISVLSIAFSI